MKFTIKGRLSLTSPLHVTAPGEAVVTIPSEKSSVPYFRFGSIQGKGEFNANRTWLTRRSLPLEELAGLSEAAVAAGRTPPLPFVELPTIPSNSFRGGLRRSGCEIITQIVMDQGKFISLGVLRGLMCGAVTANPAGYCSISDRVESDKHPYLGLFGGGPRLIRSTLRIHDSLPLIKQAAGLVPEDEPLHPISARDCLHARFFRKVEDLADGTYSNPAAVENFLASATAYLEGLADESAKRSDQRAAKKDGTAAPGVEKVKKTGLRHFGAFEVVNPGTPMSFEAIVDTRHIGAAGLGLFLLSLRNFCHEQALGGLTRWGFGGFDPYLRIVSGNDVADLITTVDGAITFHDSGSRIVEEALQAWTEFAADLDVAALERIFRLEEGE